MSLKLQNSPLVMLFVVWCTAILLVCFESPSDFWGNLTRRFTALQAKDGLLIGLTPFVTLIAVGLLSSYWKAVILFWRIRHPLPGHRAFSHLAAQDPRVDVAVLKKVVVPWPVTPAEENQTWYRLYRQIHDQPMVSDAQRAFLLSRDLAACALCFLVLGSPIILVFGTSKVWAGLYCGVMAAHFLILSVVGRNYGTRFVQNVLAEVAFKAS